MPLRFSTPIPMGQRQVEEPHRKVAGIDLGVVGRIADGEDLRIRRDSGHILLVARSLPAVVDCSLPVAGSHHIVAAAVGDSRPVGALHRLLVETKEKKRKEKKK